MNIFQLSTYSNEYHHTTPCSNHKFNMRIYLTFVFFIVTLGFLVICYYNAFLLKKKKMKIICLFCCVILPVIVWLCYIIIVFGWLFQFIKKKKLLSLDSISDTSPINLKIIDPSYLFMFLRNLLSSPVRLYWYLLENIFIYLLVCNMLKKSTWYIDNEEREL